MDDFTGFVADLFLARQPLRSSRLLMLAVLIGNSLQDLPSDFLKIRLSAISALLSCMLIPDVVITRFQPDGLNTVIIIATTAS